MTICPALESGTPTVVILFNPQSCEKDLHIRLPVGLPSGITKYAVYSSTGAVLPAQILPLTAEDSSLRSEYYAYKSLVPVQWLAFNSGPVPGMGFVALFLQPLGGEEAAASATVISTPAAPTVAALRGGLASDTTLTNGVVSLTFDGTTGFLTSYASSETGISIPMTATLLWWNSSVGSSVDDKTGDNGQGER